MNKSVAFLTLVVVFTFLATARNYAKSETDERRLADSINRLAIRILYEYNRHNEKNIAISPYLLANVLTVLMEGLSEVDFNEIEIHAKLPYVHNVTQVSMTKFNKKLKKLPISYRNFWDSLIFSNDVELVLDDAFMQRLSPYAFTDRMFYEKFSTLQSKNDLFKQLIDYGDGNNIDLRTNLQNETLAVDAQSPESGGSERERVERSAPEDLSVDELDEYGDYEDDDGDENGQQATNEKSIRNFFYVRGRAKQVSEAKFRSLTGTYRYAYLEKYASRMLRLPIANGAYYLIVLLPDLEQQIDSLIYELRKSNFCLSDVFPLAEPVFLNALIPEFYVHGTVLLSDVLRKMGIRTIFEHKNGQFDRMFNNSTDHVFVENIEQSIDFRYPNHSTDTGKNKRHANRSVNDDDDNDNNKKLSFTKFHATHPFLFFVCDSQYDVTLLVGKIVDPFQFRI